MVGSEWREQGGRMDGGREGKEAGWTGGKRSTAELGQCQGGGRLRE